MTVRATDSGNPSQSTDSTVTLFITRIPPPTFGGPYTINVREDTDVGTPVLTVVATPPATAPNANITYETSGQPPADYYFKVDPNTGVISVQNNLTSDDSTSYTVCIPTLYTNS